MSKHTPGPWEVEEDLGVFKIKNAYHDLTHKEYPLGDEYHGETKRDQANARLIAASPELLNAVKLIEILAGGNGCAEGESVKLAPKTLEQLRKAIAKAEGKE